MYEVNLDKILLDQRTPEYIKSAILQSRLIGHLTLEEFLRTISNKSLKEMQELFDLALVEQPAMESAMIATLALAAIDGVFMESSEQLEDMLKTVLICINLEALSRKGLADVNRSQLSFLYDPQAVIAKATPAGRELAEQTRKENECKTITANQQAPISESTPEASQKPSGTPQNTEQLSPSHTKPKTLWQRFLNLFRK